jgi:hypothetical protein
VLVIVASASVQGAVEFPFTYRDGFIWVQAKVQGRPEPLNMLLDSGAEVSTLALPTAQRLQLRGGRRVSVKGVGGRTTGYWPRTLQASVGDIQLPSDYLVVDLNELQDTCHCRLDGLIGADFFRAHTVQIDFVTQKIRLLDGQPNSTGAVEVPLRITQNSLQVQAQLQDHAPQWFRLDTGCATGVEWVMTGRQFEASRQPHRTVGLSAVTTSQTETTVRVGQTTLTGVHTGLHPAPIFPGEAGLIGNELLSRFSSITLDIKRQRLLLRSR